MKSILILGATGAIGAALVTRFQLEGWYVVAANRNQGNGIPRCEGLRSISVDPFADSFLTALDGNTDMFHAVVWAQGANCSDSIRNLDLAEHDRIYRANVTYILASLQRLLVEGLLADGARLCVISSIWQNIAKQNKLSYTISKSALQGLVQSLAIDLGREGFLINAVLPGALDTPMTRANLSAAQIDALEAMTPLNSLPQMDDVCGLVVYLCSQSNTGITGQFIAADRGFSYARIF